MGKYSFSLNDIKKQLGPGLGIRSNNYLLEVPLPGAKGKKLAVLCMSTSLPERNIGTVDVYFKGRRYKMRGETDLQGSYTINLIDDSEMILRQHFERWMRKEIDNTTPKSENAMSIFGDTFNDLLETGAGVVKFLNNVKTAFAFDSGERFFKNILGNKPGYPNYQVDINVWQLNKERDKVVGMKLTNAFPIEVGAIETSDEETDQLSRFSVTFAYSDTEIIKNESLGKKLLNYALGDSGNDLVDGVKNLFE